MTSSTNDLLILVADLRFATETLDLKSLEFIVDIVFVFKTRIEKDLIHRFIEIRKFRGRPILTAEISFSMGEGRGVSINNLALLQAPYTASISIIKMFALICFEDLSYHVPT